MDQHLSNTPYFISASGPILNHTSIILVFHPGAFCRILFCTKLSYLTFGPYTQLSTPPNLLTVLQLVKISSLRTFTLPLFFLILCQPSIILHRLVIIDENCFKQSLIILFTNNQVTIFRTITLDPSDKTLACD